MGEQNRRAVELERAPAAPRRRRNGGRAAPTSAADGRALGPEADERQTARQAPSVAGPGESAEDDSIG